MDKCKICGANSASITDFNSLISVAINGIKHIFRCEIIYCAECNQQYPIRPGKKYISKEGEPGYTALRQNITFDLGDL